MAIAEPSLALERFCAVWQTGVEINFVPFLYRQPRIGAHFGICALIRINNLRGVSPP